MTNAPGLASDTSAASSQSIRKGEAAAKPSSADAAIIAKVVADISFLQDRIEALRSQLSPNKAVLNTYTSMLARREVALELLHNRTAPEAPEHLDRAG